MIKKFSMGTMCTGIGSPELAAKELEAEHDIVFAAEIDKFAIKTYTANFEPGVMLGDITQEPFDEPTLYADYVVAGIPCQPFSSSGLGLGELDPRGTLINDFCRYLRIHKPKAFTLENVEGLLSNKGGATFAKWLEMLGKSVNNIPRMFESDKDSLPYNLHWKILDAKNFGLPQSRKRVFIVGIREDLPNAFRFPRGFKLNKTVLDLLEPVVPEKKYLSDDFLKRLIDGKHLVFPDDDTTVCAAIRGRGPKGAIKQQLEFRMDGVTNTITTVEKDNYVMVREATKSGFVKAEPGDTIDLNYTESTTKRGRVGKKIAHTVTTANTHHVFTDDESRPIKKRIRAFTALECMRLQGFPDSFIRPCSESQTYHQAGNSIPTTVIKAVIKNLLPILQHF